MTHNNTNTKVDSAGELLNNRYRIIRLLGRGGIGFTYKAEDIKNNQSVALKLLSLKRATDWKKLELFEREAKILAQLNHPQIPQYFDYFQIETEQDRNFYIVQQLAPGYSLDKLIEAGWKPNVQEIQQFTTQILEILIYLQELLPPVIHRDIKPQNIIRNKDGKIFLVDFGSVQDTYRQNMTQSTVVGTFGYMAPEQFRGQAVPSTDLYGLGTTLLFMLTGQSPAELPEHGLKIEFRSVLPDLDKLFADWLERLLEPKPENRFSTAKEALNVLYGKQPLPPLPPEVLPKPLNSPIKVDKNNNILSIKIPAIGFRTPQIQRFALLNLVFNGFLVFVIAMMVSLELFFAPQKLISFGALIAIGLFFFMKYTYGAFSVTQIIINKYEKSLQIDKWLLGSRYQKVRFCPRKNIPKELSEVTRLQVKQQRIWLWHKVPFYYCSLKMMSKKYKFGGFLTVAETEWLVQEISAFLQS